MYLVLSCPFLSTKIRTQPVFTVKFPNTSPHAKNIIFADGFSQELNILTSSFSSKSENILSTDCNFSTFLFAIRWLTWRMSLAICSAFHSVHSSITAPLPNIFVLLTETVLSMFKQRQTPHTIGWIQAGIGQSNQVSSVVNRLRLPIRMLVPRLLFKLNITFSIFCLPTFTFQFSSSKTILDIITAASVIDFRRRFSTKVRQIPSWYVTLPNRIASAWRSKSV